jgi:hypothetical protein
MALQALVATHGALREVEALAADPASRHAARPRQLPLRLARAFSRATHLVLRPAEVRQAWCSVTA